MYSMLASAVHVVAGGSITDPNSALLKPTGPYQYSHHQILWGSLFDAVVTLALISWMVYVWYLNYGPGANKTGENSR